MKEINDTIADLWVKTYQGVGSSSFCFLCVPLLIRSPCMQTLTKS